MRILEKGERKGQCPKCDTIFAYTENDLENEYENGGLRVIRNKYVRCPVCKAKLLEETRPV